VQVPPLGWHRGVVVDVEVVLVGVVVEVLVEVLVEVVVVCAWQVPLVLEQFPLQHWSSLVQCFPLRLHPGGSAPASPMPSDPSVPPRRSTHQPKGLTA
jgi:hypothetical protein